MTLHATIERAADGTFGIYLKEELPSNVVIYGAGETEDEAKAFLLDALALAADDYREEHAAPAPWEGATLAYRYDITAFFQAFPFINISEFARSVGINASLMRRYKMGVTRPSAAQLQGIQEALDRLAQKLAMVNVTSHA